MFLSASIPEKKKLGYLRTWTPHVCPLRIRYYFLNTFQWEIYVIKLYKNKTTNIQENCLPLIPFGVVSYFYNCDLLEMFFSSVLFYCHWQEKISSCRKTMRLDPRLVWPAMLKLKHLPQCHQNRVLRRGWTQTVRNEGSLTSRIKYWEAFVCNLRDFIDPSWSPTVKSW